MKKKLLFPKDLLLTIAVASGLGILFATLQDGTFWTGWLGFSSILVGGLAALIAATRWASRGRALAWMVALAFVFRSLGGVATYLILPVDGFDDEDDRAGFVFTDAHRRDAQAWDLADSDHPLLDAFSKTYAYDQYGGLLAFSALIYRSLSPDAHRPLMLVLISALAAALGLPFLWKAVAQMWGEKAAQASGWIFALYPESVLLGGSAMREPYLMTLSALALWGFVDWQKTHSRSAWFWLGISLVGMLLVSPVVALVTLVIFAGWVYFTSERGRFSLWIFVAAVIVFVAGLFLLSSALDRQGTLGGGTPVGVIGNFMREAVKWDVYQLERGSGWVQKLFDEMPKWLRLPFVTVYGLFQPVLPAALVEPTTSTWRIIAILRALGWYALLPMLTLSFLAATDSRSEKERWLWIWLIVMVWCWILLTSLRGGGDQWDNPRYRAILFLWQAIIAGHTWIWWRETRNPWVVRVFLMEAFFLFFFGQWYVHRYLHFGWQLPFGQMVGGILGSWLLVALFGWWQDQRRRLTGKGESL
jgi:hypothetical protein